MSLKQLQSFESVNIRFYGLEESILTSAYGLVQYWFLRSIKIHIDLYTRLCI